MNFGAIDTNIYLYLHSFAGLSPLLDLFIIFCAVYLPYTLGAIAILYVLFSSRKRAEKILAFLSAGGAIVVARFAIGSLLRIIFLRERPMLALHVQSLFPENSYSFPSGHALVLFAATGVLYFYNKRLGIFFGIFSTIACIGRIMAGVHYPSDILGGAIIGLAVASAVEHWLIPQVKKLSYFKEVEQKI